MFPAIPGDHSVIGRILSVFSGRLEPTTSDTGDEMHGEHGPTPRSVRRGRMPYDDSPPEFPAPAGPGGQDGTVTIPRFPGKGTRARPRALRAGLSGPVIVGGFLLLAGAGGLSSVWLGEAGPSAAPGHGNPLQDAPPGDDLTTAPGNAAPAPAPSLTSRTAPAEGTRPVPRPARTPGAGRTRPDPVPGRRPASRRARRPAPRPGSRPRPRSFRRMPPSWSARDPG